MFYRKLLRPAFFCLDSEVAHEVALAAARISSSPLLRPITQSIFRYDDPRLRCRVAGIEFPNPIGLAAGMDKKACAVPYFDDLGFGAIEVGSVTFKAQPGNPKPRMFRLVDDLALINRMGFPSDGAQALADNLNNLASQKIRAKIGINIGKTKLATLEAAAEDYLSSFNVLKNLGDYFVVNVSSPNTPELRKLQEKSHLKKIFQLLEANNSLNKPIFVKLAPDLTHSEIDDIIELVFELKISGIIATNTTISRDGISFDPKQDGGLSGKPLRAKALATIKYISSQTNNQVPIIGVGGIFSAQDVIDCMQAGACMVQIYTSFVYQGPALVKTILKDLSKALDNTGLTSISDLHKQPTPLKNCCN